MYQLFSSRNILKAGLAVIILALVSACSTSNKIINTYDGDTLPKEQLAVLTAPENLTLISVNGKEMPSYMLSNLSTKYGLLGGINHLVVKYESVWAKPGVKSKGEARSEKTESKPVIVSFEAIPGEAYGFSFADVDTLKKARSLAENFSASLVDAQGHSIAETKVYEGELPEDSGLSLVQKVLGNLKTEQDLAQSNSAESSNLESLKELWINTSAKDRKSFLSWAFKE